MIAEHIDKPWGKETILADEPAYGSKILTVKRGNRLSLQRHHKRDETWYVLKGSAIVTIGTIKMTLRPGGLVQVPRNVWHRLGAGKTDVQIIEITSGYVDGDIERKEDDYGRKGQTD